MFIANILLEILHERPQQPHIHLQALQCIGEIQYPTQISKLHNFFCDEFVLLIELLYIFEVVLDVFVIDGFVVVFDLVVLLEGLLDFIVLGFYLFLHVLADGVFEG